jgi:nitroreductase
MQILIAPAIVGQVDVRETVPERIEESRRPVLASHPQSEVRMSDVQMERQFGDLAEQALQVLDIREHPVQVLDHQSDAALRRVLNQQLQHLGVLLHHLLPVMHRDPLIGMDVDEFDARVCETIEPTPVHLASLLLYLREGRRDRQVPGGVADHLQAQITCQPPHLFAVGKPGGGRLQCQVHEIEPVLCDPMDLLKDGAAGEIHRSYKHGVSVRATDSVPGRRRESHILVWMETYEAIMTRRSVPKPGGASPSKEQVTKLLDAAVRAPTHHLTQPWRFVVLTGDALVELGDAWATGAEAAGDDADKAREKPLRAPLIICVIEQPHIENPKVVEVEEHHAVGSAIQNVLLAAHDMGLGAMIRTGPAAQMRSVRDHLGVKPDELIAGFIYIGKQEDREADRPMTRRAPASERTEWRGF